MRVKYSDDLYSPSIYYYNYEEKLVSNDVSFTRISRLKNVMQQYLGQTQTWKGRWILKQSDARNWDELEAYDKVLVDVPCTVDRHSANEDENSIFKPSRMKERVQLPELQSEILWYTYFSSNVIWVSECHN